MIIEEIKKTPRREAREKFAYYLLREAGLEDSDILAFLTTKQAKLEDNSPLDLIYSGEYERGMVAVYVLLDGLTEEITWT